MKVQKNTSSKSNQEKSDTKDHDPTGLFQFKDNRESTNQQKSIQQLANQSTRIQQLSTIQKMVDNGQSSQNTTQFKPLSSNKLNVAGETHGESKPRRKKEEEYATKKTGGVYKTEGEFKTRKPWKTGERLGDPMLLRVEMLLAIVKEKIVPSILDPYSKGNQPLIQTLQAATIDASWDLFKPDFKKTLDEIELAMRLASNEEAEASEASKAVKAYNMLRTLIGKILASKVTDVKTTFIPDIDAIIKKFAGDVLQLGDIRTEDAVSTLRSKAMQSAAADNADLYFGKQKGLWKVGNDHIAEIKADKKQNDAYEVLTKKEFNDDFDPWLLKNP